MIFEQLFDSESSTYTYLLGDPRAGLGALVDPVREQIDRDLARLRALGLALVYTFETHIHADHVTAGGALTEITGSRPVVSRISPVACDALRVSEGEQVNVGALVVGVLATPGHTPESLSYLVEGRVLTGDALLIGTCGRTDFQGGDAGTLYDSVHTRLFTLPDETEVYPAHDYKGQTRSTIGRERDGNARFSGRGRAEFIEIMEHLGLPPPRHIQEALPANLSCGKTPPVR